jgi:hypothetical protein
MGVGSKSGLMALGMTEFGKMIKLMGREPSFIQMAMCMKACGLMTKHMVRAPTSTQMERCMLAIGLKTNNMAMVSRPGLMVQDTKVATKMERKMAKVF